MKEFIKAYFELNIFGKLVIGILTFLTILSFLGIFYNILKEVLYISSQDVSNLN